MGSELRVLKKVFDRNGPVTAIKPVQTEESTVETPDIAEAGMPGQFRVNLFRGIKDHGQNQIDFLSDEIAQLEASLKEKYRERLFTQRMVEVMNQFYAGQDAPTV